MTLTRVATGTGPPTDPPGLHLALTPKTGP